MVAESAPESQSDNRASDRGLMPRKWQPMSPEWLLRPVLALVLLTAGLRLIG